MTYALHLATNAPRPGRRFEPVQERELHGMALSAAEGLPGASRGLVVVPEFAGPIGIPDFTAYVGSTSGILKRQQLAVPPIVSDIDAGILSVAYERQASGVVALANALGWPVSSIDGRLKRLVAIGALIERKPGEYVRPAEIVAVGRLYAIEAKVEDWRRALRQVRTYRVWADAYVLVMGRLSKRATDSLLAEVRHDRGGLVVDNNWLARPRIESSDPWRRLQAQELFAASIARGLDSPSLADCV